MKLVPKSGLTISIRGQYEAEKRRRHKKGDNWACRCVNCGLTFVHRQALRKHYTQCAGFMSVKESEASGNVKAMSQDPEIVVDDEHDCNPLIIIETKTGKVVARIEDPDEKKKTPAKLTETDKIRRSDISGRKPNQAGIVKDTKYHVPQIRQRNIGQPQNSIGGEEVTSSVVMYNVMNAIRKRTEETVYGMTELQEYNGQKMVAKAERTDEKEMTERSQFSTPNKRKAVDDKNDDDSLKKTRFYFKPSSFPTEPAVSYSGSREKTDKTKSGVYRPVQERVLFDYGQQQPNDQTTGLQPSKTAKPSAKESSTENIRDSHIYPCSHCHLRFRHQTRLSRHLKDDHNMSLSLHIGCPICLKKFNSNRDFLKHMLEHKEDVNERTTFEETTQKSRILIKENKDSRVETALEQCEIKPVAVRRETINTNMNSISRQSPEIIRDVVVKTEVEKDDKENESKYGNIKSLNKWITPAHKQDLNESIRENIVAAFDVRNIINHLRTNITSAQGLSDTGVNQNIVHAVNSQTSPTNPCEKPSPKSAFFKERLEKSARIRNIQTGDGNEILVGEPFQFEQMLENVEPYSRPIKWVSNTSTVVTTVQPKSRSENISQRESLEAFPQSAPNDISSENKPRKHTIIKKEKVDNATPINKQYMRPSDVDFMRRVYLDRTHRYDGFYMNMAPLTSTMTFGEGGNGEALDLSMKSKKGGDNRYVEYMSAVSDVLDLSYTSTRKYSNA
ncbi:hypothetical protein DPMN_145052 [Dreissena polymorpha]|uniref:C2H2-type domain-containing protein n=1 Tax=Dreissena polymorpha TaxID=45954 RepID=A0A9D4F597_DREPO|nr:hypothetical protein DPMN_145052 [Dreissena polymorpha]